jgi:phage/plasmid-associated DNA primase
MLNSNNSNPDLVFVDTQDEATYASPYDNKQWFFTKTQPTRQTFNEKGLLSFPFPFGYKLQNNIDRYGKKIIPFCAWKNVDNLKDLKPNLKSPHNYALLTGKKNGIIVIDYDFPKLDDGEQCGLEWLKSLFPEEHKFWTTYRVKSGSGGQHFYFKYDERLKISGSRCIYMNGKKSNLSLDIRTDGGCITAENSINEVGSYDKICGSIDDILEIPKELLHYLIKPKTTTTKIINTNTLNLTNRNINPDNRVISEEKLSYFNLLNDEEHLFGDYENWFFLARLCASHYNFNTFYTISQKAPSKSGKKGRMDVCREQFDYASDAKYEMHFGEFIKFLQRNLQEKYDEHFGYINKYIYNGDDEGFNQLLYHTYKNRFKYDPDNELWYECVNGLWTKRDKKNLVLRRLIADEFVKIFWKKDYYLAGILTNLTESNNADEITKIEGLKKKLMLQVKWCRSNNKRASFITSNADMFCDYDFLTKLDSNEISGHLFSFTNGYIDLNEYKESKNLIFHRHKAENYISMTCGYDFKPRSEIDNEIYKEMNDLVHSILPDEQDYRYTLQAFSSCLTACNNNEIAICLYGRTGGNGKGLLATIIMKEVFGDFCGTFKTQNITGKSKIDPEAASSGLAGIMKCRYVYMAEPEKDEEINNEALKILTGGDEIQYRKLHQNMLKAIPSFTIALQTNNILNTDCYDEAIWRRLKYIYFNQTFRVDPDESKGEKKADPTLKKKIQCDLRYKQAFIHLLIDNYTDILVDTDNIKKYTALSRNDNDTIKNFIDERIVQCVGEMYDTENYNAYNTQKFLTLKQLKEEYHSYHQLNFDEKCPYKLKDLKNAFLAKIGDQYKQRYSTTIYHKNFTNNNAIEPVRTNTNREKKKNWSDVFIGYKIHEDFEYTAQNNQLDEIEYVE